MFFENGEKIQADAVLLALGGASWPRLGSDGGWVDILKGRGVDVRPLKPANCGFVVAWTDLFGRRFAGQPLKSIALTSGEKTVQGEIMIAEKGVEGGAVYALSAFLRNEIERKGSTVLNVDLRPDLSRARRPSITPTRIDPG